MAERREALVKTLQWSSVGRAIRIAVVVGTMVNLINQGPEMLTGHWPIMWKLALTYCVPIVVASYCSYLSFRSSP